MTPKTLLAIAGRKPDPSFLSNSVLVLIDFQNEMRDGELKLPDIEAVIKNAAILLECARQLHTRIIHVAHNGMPGGLLDRRSHRGEFIRELTPWPWESVVGKTRPNAFTGTELARLIGQPGMPIIVAGLMTHNCVSSTVRAALDHGYPVTLVQDACATRDLPYGDGIIKAADLHRAEIAALADRHAWIVNAADLAWQAQLDLIR